MKTNIEVNLHNQKENKVHRAETRAMNQQTEMSMFILKLIHLYMIEV